MLCSNFSDAHIWSLECMWSLLHTRVFSSISSVYQFPFQFPKWFPRRRLHSLKGGNFISSMRLGGKRKGIWELVVRKCTNRHRVEGPQTELWLFSVLIILRWFAWICPSLQQLMDGLIIPLFLLDKPKWWVFPFYSHLLVDPAFMILHIFSLVFFQLWLIQKPRIHQSTKAVFAFKSGDEECVDEECVDETLAAELFEAPICFICLV